MNHRIVSLLALGVLSVFVSAADPPAKDANKTDLERMQGDWAVASMIVDGARASDDEAQSIFQTIKGDQFTLFLFNKALFKGSFKIDATKRPRTIDTTMIAGPGKEYRTLGIYEIEGNTLKFCTAQPGKERPTDFTAKKGSGHDLTVWEREKK